MIYAFISETSKGINYSANAYSVYSQLPSILQAVPPSATWRRAKPWWQGPTYHEGHDHIEILLYTQYLLLRLPEIQPVHSELFWNYVRISIVDVIKKTDSSNKSAEFFGGHNAVFYNETNGFSLQEWGTNSKHGTGIHVVYPSTVTSKYIKRHSLRLKWSVYLELTPRLIAVHRRKKVQMRKHNENERPLSIYFTPDNMQIFW